jgi:hypothetical protein
MRIALLTDMKPSAQKPRFGAKTHNQLSAAMFRSQSRISSGAQRKQFEAYDANLVG